MSIAVVLRVTMPGKVSQYTRHDLSLKFILMYVFEPIFHLIFQKKAIGELYRVIPFSSSGFNVCGSCAHLPIQTSIEQPESVNALRLYCTDIDS